MLKLDTQLPIVPDIENQELKDYLIAVKQYCEEIARKASSQQVEVRSTIPGIDDLQEGESVRYVSGATVRTYTKINGVVRYVVET